MTAPLRDSRDTIPSLVRRGWIAPLAIGAAASLAALGLTVLLRSQLKETQFVFFFAAVILSAWVGGQRAGMTATVLSVVLADWFVLSPLYALELSSPRNIAGLLSFGGVSTLINYWSQSLRSARARAEQHARIVEEQSAALRAQTQEMTRQVDESRRLHEELQQTNAEIAAVNARLERGHEVQRFLLEASITLASSLDYEITLKSVANLAVRTLADWCTVAIARSDGTYETVALAHRDPDRVRWAEEYARMYPPTFDEGNGVIRVLRSGRSEYYRDIPPELLARVGHSEEERRAAQELGMRSAMIVPISAWGQTFGAVTLITSDSRRHFTMADLSVAEDLATRAGLAIQNARLFAGEKEARTIAERTMHRADLLSRASGLLAESLDLEHAMQRLVSLITANMGEYAQIYLLEGETLRRACLSCTAPEAMAAVEEIERRPPFRLDHDNPVSRVARSGAPTLFARIEPEVLGMAQDASHAEQVRGIGMRSMIVAPLSTRGRTIGVLLIARITNPVPYDDHDLTLAVELAHRAGAAVDNALLYAQAQRARRDAEVANQAKGEFLAAMSHELRTPLNAIGGYAELIEMGIHGPVTPEQREALSRIRRSQHLLQTLVEELLSFAKIEAGKLKYEIADVPVHDAVDRVADLMTVQMQAKSLLYECRPGDRTLAVRADRDRVEQIMFNLLTNAVKFTPEGGRITVDVAASGNDVVVSVADTGVGIPAEKLEAVFEPFVQLAQVQSRRGEGIGLGLAISRELARAMHGDLTVTSEVGKGSTFSLRLPRAVLAPDASAVERPRQSTMLQ